MVNFYLVSFILFRYWNACVGISTEIGDLQSSRLLTTPWPRYIQQCRFLCGNEQVYAQITYIRGALLDLSGLNEVRRVQMFKFFAGVSLLQVNRPLQRRRSGIIRQGSDGNLNS